MNTEKYLSFFRLMVKLTYIPPVTHSVGKLIDGSSIQKGSREKQLLLQPPASALRNSSKKCFTLCRKHSSIAGQEDIERKVLWPSLCSQVEALLAFPLALGTFSPLKSFCNEVFQRKNKYYKAIR